MGLEPTTRGLKVLRAFVRTVRHRCYSSADLRFCISARPRRTSSYPSSAAGAPSSSHLGVGGRHPVAPLRGETERPVGPLECTSARKADSGTHGGGGAGKILKKIQAWLSIRRQGVRRR